MTNLHEAHAIAASRKPRFRVAVAKADFDFCQSLEVDDTKVTGRQLLEVSGFKPSEEYLLFQALDDGALEERRLDELIELDEKKENRFIVFHSDRSFRVEIDGRRFEWGEVELTGRIAKQIVGARSAGVGLWLVRQSGYRPLRRGRRRSEALDRGSREAIHRTSVLALDRRQGVPVAQSLDYHDTDRHPRGLGSSPRRSADRFDDERSPHAQAGRSR